MAGQQLHLFIMISGIDHNTQLPFVCSATHWLAASAISCKFHFYLQCFPLDSGLVSKSLTQKHAMVHRRDKEREKERQRDECTCACVHVQCVCA